MAAIIGKDGIHKVIGQICDLCGQECDGEKEELNALGCTYPACNEEASVYHQDCIEKYLRSIRLEKNRKTGYHCPRGSSKHSSYSDAPCPGRVTKSHPIHIRNDQAKKRQKAKPAEPAPAPLRPLKGKDKAAAAEAQAHNKSKSANATVGQNLKDKSAQVKAKPKAAEGQVKHLAGPSVVKQEPATKPTAVVKLQEAPKVTPSLDKHQMKDAVYRAKLELGLQASPPVKTPKTAAAAAAAATTSDHQISKEEESTKAARPIRAAAAQPAVSAWQRSSSIASIVRSSSPQTASDAGSLRSETPRSLASEERTPTRHQPQQDSKSVVSSSVAGPKDVQVQAAASPMTPNAIKAFQPDQLSDSQSDCDTPLASATEPHSPGACPAEGFPRTSFDGQSTCSDEVSDALFAMDPSSESDGDKLIAPSLQEPADSIELETHHDSAQQGSDFMAAAKLLRSHCLQGKSETQLTHSSHSSDNGKSGKQAAGAQLDQQFLQAVGLQKALACAIQYQTLGFSRLQGIAAVNKWGDDVHAALGWLLNHNEVAQENADDTPTVDISHELGCLREWQQAFTLTQEVLQQMVISADGNWPLSFSLMQSSSQILHASSVECPKHSRGLLVDGKGCLSSLQQMTPNSIAPLSSQHLVIEDSAAHHLQTCRL